MDTLYRLRTTPPGSLAAGGSGVTVRLRSGPPGKDGATGPAGAGAGIDHPFAFGDAAQVVYTAPATQRLVAVVVSIRVAMDGSGPLIRVGKVGTGSPPEDVLDDKDIDAKSAGIYGYELDYPLLAGDQLMLTITPSTSTAGSGVLTLYFV